METLQTVAEIDAALGSVGCVLVPTMGALHAGHLALVEQGRNVAHKRGCPLVVSIFVNPAQFNDPDDLASYPRPLDRDLEQLSRIGTDLAFVPDVDQVYPDTDAPMPPQPEVPPVGRLPGLEDRYRPGHFEGVCRVVSRLFDLCNPSAAIFGEKDWQQSRVVSAMAAQQGRSTEILVGPTVREPDGLAMSSRNQHLTSDTRSRAVGIWDGLQAARRTTDVNAAEHILAQHMASSGFEIEYATIRYAETLMPPDNEANKPLRILAAGMLDDVRLLDNAPWPA